MTIHSPVAEKCFDYSPASPSFSTNFDLCDLLVNQPPPSILPSEASSPLVSDSDLPPLPPIKAIKQTNLLNFFSKTPSTEHHTKWQKRKRDNKDKDREELAKRKQKGEAEKLHNLENKRAKNRVSQKKRRNRLKEEKATLSEVGQDFSVSSLVYIL